MYIFSINFLKIIWQQLLKKVFLSCPQKHSDVIEKNMRLFLVIGILFCSISPTRGSATLIGNPAQPSLQNSGLIRECPQWWSFRVSYYGDYVYNQKFHEEFVIDGATITSSDLKLWTQAGMLTFNFRNRIDLYGIVGGLRMQIDEEVMTKQQLAWGVGGKNYHFSRRKISRRLRF